MASSDSRASRTSSFQLDRASLASLFLWPHCPHSHYHHSLNATVPCVARRGGCGSSPGQASLQVHPEWVSSRSRGRNFKLVINTHHHHHHQCLDSWGGFAAPTLENFPTVASPRMCTFRTLASAVVVLVCSTSFNRCSQRRRNQLF